MPDQGMQDCTIRIMGQPWRIEMCDLPDEDDPEYESRRYYGQQLICIKRDLPPASQARQVFYHVAMTLYNPLIYGDGEAKSRNEEDAIFRALWAGLRDNREAVATWFGWRTGTPDVQEGALSILGQPWQLRRVRRIPGYSVDTYGLEATSELVIYVRNDITPYFAAEVALHETIHAAVKGVNVDVGSAEEFIRPMAIGLAQVFFDNPEVMIRVLGVTPSQT